MGSTEIIKIDYESITNVSIRLANLCDTVAQLKSLLQNQSQQLQTTWEGSAAVRFFQEMETDIFPTFDRLSQVLNTSSSVSSQIAKTFREAEQAAARLFQGSIFGIPTNKSQSINQTSASAAPTNHSPSTRAEDIKRQFEEFKRNRPERSPTIDYFPSGFSGIAAWIWMLGRKTVKLTQREADLIDALQPWEKASFEGIKNEAFLQEQKYFNTPGQNNADGPADAFRHALWSARLTQEYGAEWAKNYTNAHEEGEGNPTASEFMDRTNNALGIRIAQENPHASPEELAEKIFTAIKHGEGVYISGANDHPKSSIDRERLLENGTIVPTNEQLGKNDVVPDTLPQKGYNEEW